MKVALIVSGFPTAERQNSGVFTLRSAQRLARTHDIEVFHLRTWQPGRRFVTTADVEGLRVTTVWLPQLPQSYRSHWRTSLNWGVAAIAGWRLIGKRLRAFDVLHSVGAAFAGVLASRWSRRAGRPHVAQVIGADVNSILPLIDGWWPIRGWTRHVHAFSANSAALAGELRGRYPSAVTASVVYRGTDLARFSPPPVPRSGKAVRFLFAHGFPDYGELRFGGNQKGGWTICEAWAQAESRLLAAGATLTLAGPRSDAPEVEAWRKALRDPDAVRILGVVPPDDMPSHMRAADVLLVASMEDGLPNVAVEASACGCAIAGSRVGGIPEIVSENETGVLLPAGDAPAWAAALADLAMDPERVRRMGLRGRERAERLFDASGYVGRMESIYAAAMSGVSGPAR